MSGTSLRIRDFHPKDLETLYEIDRLCFPAEIAFTRRDFLYMLGYPDSIARIAHESCGVVGFILGNIESGRRGRILTLDVVPAARRRGIGFGLMEDFHHILRTRNIREVVLEVGTDNYAAQRLYEKMQYRRVETLSGYYGGNMDAYRMMRIV